MSISSNFRWVAVGSLNIRNHANAPAGAAEFTLDEVIGRCQAQIDANAMHRLYAADTKLMWISNIGETDNFYVLLVHTGDKNVAGMALVDFYTMDARDIEKAEQEGGLYSSHILIRKQFDENERFPILIEKVPGVHLRSIKDHLNWLCNRPDFKKIANDQDGNSKSYRPIFEIDGYQSCTVAEAIAGGVLKDVEFISIEKVNTDGLDEDFLIDEVIHQAKWDINKKVPVSRIDGLFGWLRERRPANASKMFVRIQTGNGQTKTTEVDPDSEAMLEAAFVQNEIVTGFEQPLGARHECIRADVVEKMAAKAP